MRSGRHEVLQSAGLPRWLPPDDDQPVGEGQFMVDDPQMLAEDEAIRVAVAPVRILDDGVEGEDPEGGGDHLRAQLDAAVPGGELRAAAGVLGVSIMAGRKPLAEPAETVDPFEEFLNRGKGA